MMRSSLRKYALFCLKVGITAGLIWLVVRNVDMSETMTRVRGIPFWVVPVSLALLIVQLLFAAMRWRIILRQFDGSLSLPMAIRLYLEGQFFNQALPSTIGGDGVRMYRAYRAGMRLETAINSVILDRVLGLASLVLLVALAQPLFYERVSDLAARMTFSAIFVLAVLGIGVLLALSRLPSRLQHLSLVRGLVALSTVARRAFVQPATLIPVVGLSVAGHLCVVAYFYLVAVNLGLTVTFVDCLVLVPSVLLLATVPISVAGWGLREGAMVAAFGLIGVPAGGAAAVSVLFGIGLIVTGLPGGVLWLLNPDRRLAKAADLSHPETPAA